MYLYVSVSYAAVRCGGSVGNPLPLLLFADPAWDTSELMPMTGWQSRGEEVHRVRIVTYLSLCSD